MKSIFNPDNQIVSVYYIVETNTIIPDSYFEQNKDSNYKGELHFTWLPINTISEKYFTLPIDKHVANLLKNIFKNP